MTEAVLFDWDGTLLDSREALLRAWHASTGEILGRRFPATPEEEALVFTQPGSVLFPRVAGAPARAAKLTVAFQEAYERGAGDVRAFPGILSLLAQLREGGVRIAVVTSKARRRFTADARRAALDGLVDLAVCQEQTRRHKPDPAPVRHALQSLDVSARRAVMVGDTPVDIEAGRGAGTVAIGVAWGAAGERELLDAGACAVAHDADELHELVLSAHARCTAEVTR